MSAPAKAARSPRLRFDRHELAGAFGDIGTDLPLLLALIAACDLDAASVCVMFGLAQIATGLVYGMPMPVQPLKAMAAIMISQRLSAGTMAGAGLVIGGAMALLAASGLLERVARNVPKEVVRGIQLGLGVTLASLALGKYAAADGARGYVLAVVATVALLVLRRQRRVPAPLVVIALGAIFAFATADGGAASGGLFGLHLPTARMPTRQELADGALLLALPQLPLSLGNSIIATSQTSRDLFPDRAVDVRRLGLTFGVLNLVGPWFGGVPVCHGCGGLVGFHAFGGRTGGAPVIYGAMYLVLGLFFGPGFEVIVRAFPLPLLGAILLFEAIAIMVLVRDVAGDRRALWITLAVAAVVVGLPYGYVVGLVGGSLLALGVRRGWISLPGADAE